MPRLSAPQAALLLSQAAACRRGQGNPGAGRGPRDWPGWAGWLGTGCWSVCLSCKLHATKCICQMCVAQRCSHPKTHPQTSSRRAAGTRTPESPGASSTLRRLLEASAPGCGGGNPGCSTQSAHRRLPPPLPRSPLPALPPPLLSPPPACLASEHIQMPPPHFFAGNPAAGPFSISFPRVNCHRDDHSPSC